MGESQKDHTRTDDKPKPRLMSRPMLLLIGASVGLQALGLTALYSKRFEAILMMLLKSAFGSERLNAYFTNLDYPLVSGNYLPLWMRSVPVGV
jgi:hypothetical protein